MTLRLVICAALLGSACHSSSSGPASGPPAPSAPSSTAEQDALWKLAPAGVTIGFVASPRALQMSEHALADVQTFLDASPDFAPVNGELKAALAKHQLKALTLADAGLTSDHGLAVFIAGKHTIVILPVVDRDKLMAFLHGTKGEPTDTLDHDTTCMTTHGVYACTDAAELFDALGKGALGEGALSVTAAGARGDLEVAGKDLTAGPTPVSFAVVGQLARGAVTFRGTVDGIPASGLELYGKPSKPRTEGDKTTGFAMFNAKGQIANLPWLFAAQITPDVDLGALVKTFEDPIAVTSQSTTLDLYIPLSDPALAHKLVEQCGQGPIMAAVGAKVVDGACQLALPYAPTTAIAVRVDGNVLHVGQVNAPAGATVEQTALGKELADGSWQLAVYGRGSVLGMSETTAHQLQQAPLPPPSAAMLGGVLRGMSMVNEVGVGVRIDGPASPSAAASLHFELALRTAWSNPDPVVAQLLQIQGADVLAGHAAERVAPIVAANPSAPLAGDVQAGFTGMMGPVTVVGALAAVAIPAFMDYMKKSKRSDAELQLTRIGKNLKVYYVTNAQFPAGDGALLPAAPCCQGPGAKCPAAPEAFRADKLWSELDFEFDTPSLYQYRYHSDGKTALVEAIGDLDCDGTAVTYRLHVDAPSGNPTVSIEAPPPNSD